MPAAVYEVLSVACSYWFALLGVLIVWRAALWVRGDARLRKRMLRRLPDAGYIGELVALEHTGASLKAGDDLPLPREGWIGGARSCDVCIPQPGLPPRVAHFELKNDGLYITPYRGGKLSVDDVPVEREAVLHHGAVLTVDTISCQLRLFEGIEEDEIPAEPTAERPAKRRLFKRGKKELAPPREEPVTDWTDEWVEDYDDKYTDTDTPDDGEPAGNKPVDRKTPVRPKARRKSKPKMSMKPRGR